MAPWTGRAHRGRAASPFGAAYHITVQMVRGAETGPERPSPGTIYLVRCGASSLEERLQDWQMYLRKPLFAACSSGRR
ncbi:MAG: hypothetical protein R3A10_14400 [Caldilineaceae bacterium]